MPGNLKSLDAKEHPPYGGATLKLGYKTPFTGNPFPPPPERLLWMIRRRLIGFVNEYGDESPVADYKCIGKITHTSIHAHDLQRRSTRSEKRYFKAYTGVVDYQFDELDEIGRWLLNLGFTIGCGPDSSFGCGFLQDLTESGKA
jgi:CRISPR/Cas system endoribonuclease Cas6 (RAMP superfamily)